MTVTERVRYEGLSELRPHDQILHAGAHRGLDHRRSFERELVAVSTENLPARAERDVAAWMSVEADDRYDHRQRMARATISLHGYVTIRSVGTRALISSARILVIAFSSGSAQRWDIKNSTRSMSTPVTIWLRSR